MKTNKLRMTVVGYNCLPKCQCSGDLDLTLQFQSIIKQLCNFSWFAILCLVEIVVKYVIYTTISTNRKIHCNPVQGRYRARTGFSLSSKFSQGKTCFHYREPLFSLQRPCFHYRNFPVRESSEGNPVFITGNGFAVL